MVHRIGKLTHVDDCLRNTRTCVVQSLGFDDYHVRLHILAAAVPQGKVHAALDFCHLPVYPPVEGKGSLECPTKGLVLGKGLG